MEDDSSEHNGGDMMFCPILPSYLFVINAHVTREEVTNFTQPESDLIPRLLESEWTGKGEPQKLLQKVVLGGSKDSKFLTIRQPPIPIGMSGMMRSGVQ